MGSESRLLWLLLVQSCGEVVGTVPQCAHLLNGNDNGYLPDGVLIPKRFVVVSGM